MNFLPDKEREEIERSAELYDQESKDEDSAYNDAWEKPTPESTHLDDLYALFIEEERDTIKHHQEWISLLISLKEGEGPRSPICQMCEVYLNEHKIYLNNAVRDLERMRL